MRILVVAVLAALSLPSAAQTQMTREIPVYNAAHRFDPIDVQDPGDMAAAQVYAETFERLVQTKAWPAASAIAPLREAFQASPRLSQPSFTQAWQRWDVQRLMESWFVDDQKKGLWRAQDNAGLDSQGNPNKGLTIGFRQQPDGRWWAMLLRTKADPGVSSWKCSPTCQIVVSAGGRRIPITARPPVGYNSSSSDIVGFPMPMALVSNRSEWIWTVQPPDTSEPPAEFDMSWFPSLCRQKLRTCP